MLSDKEIVNGCKKGYPKEQRLLYIRYAPVLKGICVRYLKDKEKASDVLQDAFIKIYKNIHQYTDKGSLEGWLRKIVINTCLDHMKVKRSRHLEVQLTEDLIGYEVSEDLTAPENEMMDHVLNFGFTPALLMDVLLEIPENYSRVFNMMYIDGMSHRDISEILQISEALSRKWAFRAKDLVKRQLIEYVKIRINNQ